jgi:serine/threonine protein kinase
VNKASGFNGDIFFVCGELCAAGDMWAYQVHKESFTEPFGRRILGQLARGLRVMKHSGEIGREMSDFDRGLAHITAGESLVVKGCFHRDIKLENIIVYVQPQALR